MSGKPISFAALSGSAPTSIFMKVKAPCSSIALNVYKSFMSGPLLKLAGVRAVSVVKGAILFFLSTCSHQARCAGLGCLPLVSHAVRRQARCFRRNGAAGGFFKVHGRSLVGCRPFVINNDFGGLIWT